MEDIVRVGRISSINYDTGMARVTYSDRDASTTVEMPYINFNSEYIMPVVGDQVLTVHMSNGTSRGVIIGTMWNKKNTPADTGKGIYRKEYANIAGRAYCKFSDSSGEYELVVPEATLQASGTLEISGKNVTLYAKKTTRVVGSNVSLEDGSWSTSLSSIMERLAALDGNTSDKKGES